MSNIKTNCIWYKIWVINANQNVTPEEKESFQSGYQGELYREGDTVPNLPWRGTVQEAQYLSWPWLRISLLKIIKAFRMCSYNLNNFPEVNASFRFTKEQCHQSSLYQRATLERDSNLHIIKQEALITTQNLADCWCLMKSLTPQFQ